MLRSLERCGLSTSLRGAALTALLLSTTQLTSIIVSSPALAQAATQSFSFDISSQPLSQALVQFSRISGVDIVFDGALQPGARTTGVHGKLTAGQALDRLLSGTGLSWEFSAARTVVLRGGAQSPQASISPDGSLLLDTISVSGGGGASADQPFETPGSTSYISAEQIQIVPPASTGDMFKNAPGVYAAGNRNGQSINVNIRGLQGMNRVATLIDGAQQSSSTYRGYKGTSSRTFVDPEFIGGIEIEKGPSSGPLGSGSMGGVVNMRTITADDIVMDGNTYGVKVKGGIGGNSIDPMSYLAPPDTLPQRFGDNDVLSGGNRVGSVAVATKAENFELLGAFAYRRNGNYFAGKNGERPVKRYGLGGSVTLDPMSRYKPGGEVFNTSQDTKSALLKGKVDFAEDQSLELSYMRFDSTYGEEYADTNNPFSPYAWDVYQANLSRAKSDMYTAKYAWNPQDNDLVDFHANLWHTRVSDHWAAIEFLTGSPSDATILTTGGEVWNTSRFDTLYGGLDVRYGASYSYEDVSQNPGKSLSMEGDREVGALFASADYKPLDWLTLSAGLRYEEYKTTDNNAVDPVGGLESDRLNPRLGVTVEPLEGLQLFATYAEGWRPPSVRETIFTMPPQLESNPFLRPEQSKNYEIGLNYLKEGVFLADDKLRFKAVYFNNYYKDYIVRAYGNRAGLPIPSRVYANIDGAKFRGVELSMSYDTGRFFTEANFNRYTNVKYCFAARNEQSSCKDEAPPDDYTSVYVPPEYSGSITVGARFLDESLTVGGRVTFAGERAIKRTSGVESDWRSYQVYDAFMSYDVNDNLSVNASLENVFDLYYLDALTESLVPSPGRTLRLSATARF